MEKIIVILTVLILIHSGVYQSQSLASNGVKFKTNSPNYYVINGNQQLASNATSGNGTEQNPFIINTLPQTNSYCFDAFPGIFNTNAFFILKNMQFSLNCPNFELLNVTHAKFININMTVQGILDIVKCSDVSVSNSFIGQIAIEGSNITIMNNTLKFLTMNVYQAPIFIHSTNILITDNNFYNTTFNSALEIYGTNITLENNAIIGKSRTGMIIGEKSYNESFFSEICRECYIINNTENGLYNGYEFYVENATITGNKANGNTNTGYTFTYSKNTIFKNNNSGNNKYGIGIEGQETLINSTNYYENNDVENNNIGFYLFNTSRQQLINNTVKGNGKAFVFNTAFNNSLIDNQLQGNNIDYVTYRSSDKNFLIDTTTNKTIIISSETATISMTSQQTSVNSPGMTIMITILALLPLLLSRKRKM